MKYLDKKFDFTKTAVTSIYDETFLWGAYFGQLLFEHIPLKKNLRVLDIGCATGFPLFELAHRLGPTTELTGIDIWETAIDRARHKKAIYGLENVSLVLGDASKMPFEDAHFDLIVSNLGINNFADPKKVSLECFRILKHGGQLLLTTNVIGHMDEFYQAFEKVLRNLNKEYLIPALEKQVTHRGTAETVHQLLTGANFKIKKKVEKEMVWRYSDGTAFLNHSLTVIGFLESWRNLLTGEDERIIFKHLETELNRIAEVEGELKMTIPMLLMHVEKN